MRVKESNHRPHGCNPFAVIVLAAGLILGAPVGAEVSPAGSDPGFPDLRPATRAQAVELVAGSQPYEAGFLTARLRDMRRHPLAHSSGTRRAMTLLMHRPMLAAHETLDDAAHGLRVHFTTADDINRLGPADLDGDGQPDVLAAVLDGLSRARTLLVDGLGLPAPERSEVFLVSLGGRSRGYVIPYADNRGEAVIVLEAAPTDGAASARRAAIHEYAHAVALANGPLPVEWAEALATWAVLRIESDPDPETARRLANRIERMSEGLLVREIGLAAGNALWLSFIEEAYGAPALRNMIDELAAGGPVDASLDRALRQVSPDTLAAAFREFQLWTLLVGPRADGLHFPFAGRLGSPVFASTVDGLPALSVQSDPAVAPWGATQVRLDPREGGGGLNLRFEGDFSSRWQADLVLVGVDGQLRRLALELSAEGRGETTVPLDGLTEAILLIRNLGSDDRQAQRYTYAAHLDPTFPFEMTSLQANPVQTGIAITWETASEQDLLGFNVLRVREDGGREVVVNPVWVPALGNLAQPATYHFLDRSAERDVSYDYRVQGITHQGLTTDSTSAAARR